MRIGYLGPVGTHSQSATECFLSKYSQSASGLTVPMDTLSHIIQAVEENALDMGCIPAENALEGSVAEVLDSLALNLEKTHIIAEFIRPIQHALIRHDKFLKGIAYIHSHPQAIGQCREALYTLLGKDVKFIPASSTSEAVKALLSLDETHAALGSTKAAEHYGLEILVENIGNLDQNATRFFIISAHETAGSDFLIIPSQTPVKTSLCIGLFKNKPGALLEILTLLAEHHLNMSKIESRPTKKSLGDYLFYLDIEGSIPPPVETLLQQKTQFYKCLGVYPVLGMLND